MKLTTSFLLAAFCTSIYASESYLFEWESRERVPLTTGRIYVPDGYDTNDDVEIAIIGRLPDLCHRNPTYEVEREENSFTIRLYAYWVPLAQGCRKVSLPYQETVSLGALPEGKYSIELKGFRVTGDNAEVQVKAATNQLQDDYIYGNVMGIKEDEAGRGIELVGTNPVDCFKFDRLEAIVQESVIVLKPRFVQQGVCKENPTSFSIRYDVPYLPKHPKGILLHVRTMAGRSYNYLYQNLLIK